MSLAILTTVFNADPGSVRLTNVKTFVTGLGRASQLLHIAECRTDGRPFVLRHLPNVRCFRAKSNLWQKERLLSLLLEGLDDAVDAVAWVDADLIFHDRDWWRSALQKLEDVDVLQPFSLVSAGNGAREARVPSYCSKVVATPTLSNERFAAHGHTGYAWAVRRELVSKAGFYDLCVVGGADHVMAHGFLGQLESKCVPPLLDSGGPQFRSYAAWVDSLGSVSSPFRLGVVDGVVEHLPHGTVEGREYMLRNRLLREARFDPAKHLTVNADGCWEWTARARRPRTVVDGYFRRRRSDER